jgi:hypothetical protein
VRYVGDEPVERAAEKRALALRDRDVLGHARVIET